MRRREEAEVELESGLNARSSRRVVVRVGEGGGLVWFLNFFFEYLDPYLLRYCSKGVPLLSMVVCLAYNNKIHIF